MEMDNENGYIVTVTHGRKYFIPEEILTLILSYVDCDSLVFNCRLVCQAWRTMVDTVALRHKAESEYALPLRKSYFIEPKDKTILPWFMYYLIMKNTVFGRNFLKNACGQDELRYWKMWSSGGDGWMVEATPIGADPMPQSDDFEGRTSCFVTSYHSCSKDQLINLNDMGLSPKMMDELQPVIRISEWYTGRFDCGCIYELKAVLLNKRKKPIVDFEFRKSTQQWEKKAWELVEHEFKSYGPGVRYVLFYHGGTDTQFWKGHYGSKISGGTVKAFIPEEIPETLYEALPEDDSSCSSSSSSSSSSNSSNNGDDVAEVMNPPPSPTQPRQPCFRGIM